MKPVTTEGYDYAYPCVLRRAGTNSIDYISGSLLDAYGVRTGFGGVYAYGMNHLSTPKGGDRGGAVMSEPVPMKKVEFTLKFFANTAYTMDIIRSMKIGFFKKDGDGHYVLAGNGTYTYQDTSNQAEYKWNWNGIEIPQDALNTGGVVNTVVIQVDYEENETRIRVNDFNELEFGGLTNLIKEPLYPGFMNADYNMSIYVDTFQVKYDLINVNTIITRTSLQDVALPENHTFSIEVYDEYNHKIPDRTVRVNSNKFAKLSFSGTSGVSDPQEPNKYYNVTTNSNGVASLTVTNNDNSGFEFDVAARSVDDYVYNDVYNDTGEDRSDTVSGNIFWIKPNITWNLTANKYYFESNEYKINPVNDYVTLSYDNILFNDMPVNLYRGSTLVASGTTDSNGKFYFNLSGVGLNSSNSYDTLTQTYQVLFNTDYDNYILTNNSSKNVTFEKQDLEVDGYILHEMETNQTGYARYPGIVEGNWSLESPQQGQTITGLTCTVKRYLSDNPNNTVTIANTGTSFLDTPTPAYSGDTAKTYMYQVSTPGNNTFKSATALAGIVYRKGDTSITVTEGSYAEDYVQQPITIKAVLKAWNGTAVANKTIKYSISYTNGISSETGTLTTDANGKFSLTRTKNSPTTASIDFTYEGDNYYFSSTRHNGMTWNPKNTTLLSMDYVQANYYYPEEAEVYATLKNDANAGINGQQVKIYRENTLIATKTTNENGEVSIKDTPTPLRSPNKYTYRAVYDGTVAYDGAEATTQVGYYDRTTITILEATQEKYAFEQHSVTMKLTHANNNQVMKNTNVSVSVVLTKEDGTVIDSGILDKTYTTNNEGKLTVNYACNAGAVIGIFSFNYKGDTTHEPSILQRTVYWKQIPVTMSTTVSDDTEVTLPGTASVTIKDARDDTPIKNRPMGVRLTLARYGSSTPANLTPINTSINTDNDGKVTTTHTPYVGDITGTFTFTFNHEAYVPTSKSCSMNWEKIKTKLTFTDVEMYATRYTNLNLHDNIDWTVASPGVNSDYKNFRGRLVTVNTRTSYEYVPSGEVNISIVGNLPVSNGDVLGRYTRELVNTRTHTASYSGSELFKPSSCTFTSKTLRRVTATLTKYTEVITQPNSFRYSIPFRLGAKLTEPAGNMSGYSVRIVYDGVTLYSDTSTSTNRVHPKTNSNGVATVTYTPFEVKTVPVLVYYNENDDCDKYLPTSISYSLVIEKEITHIVMNMFPQIITIDDSEDSMTAWEIAELKMTLKDTLERGLAGHTLHLEDYWKKRLKQYGNNGDFITDSTGKALYYPDAWAGISYFKATYDGNNFYLPSSNDSWVEYKVDRNYNNLRVQDGVAHLHHDRDIPEGYYLVDEEYVDDVKPRRYGRSTNQEHMAILRQTHFRVSGETLVECGKQYYIEAQLLDEEYRPLAGMKVVTKVNSTDSEVYTTDEEGKVRRYHVNESPGDTDLIYFKFGTTSPYKQAVIEVPVTTTKRELTFQLPYGHEVYSYMEVPYTVTARLGYVLNVYDRDDEGVLLKNSDGTCKLLATTDVPISGLPVELYSASRDELLSRAYTNDEGIVELTNSRHTLTTEKVEVIVPENDLYKRLDKYTVEMYNSTLFMNQLYITTSERITPEFQVVSSQKGYVGIPMDIIAILRAPRGRDTYTGVNDTTLEPLVNKVVRLKQKKDVASLRTDNGGSVTFSRVLTPASVGKSSFQLIYDHEDGQKYEKAVHLVELEAQIGVPVMTISVDKHSLVSGEEITITCQLMYNNTPMVNARIDIFDMLNSSTEEDGLGQTYTDDEGKSTYTYTPAPGTHQYRGKYYGSKSKYQAVDKSTYDVNAANHGAIVVTNPPS